MELMESAGAPRVVSTVLHQRPIWNPANPLNAAGCEWSGEDPLHDRECRGRSWGHEVAACDLHCLPAVKPVS